MTKEEAIEWARRPSLREAAQQALEALEIARMNGKAGLYPAEVKEIADAITALRAALAEPTVDLVAEGRPATLAEIVAKARRDLEAVGGFDNGLIGVPASGVRLLIERLEAALAEPQEPEWEAHEAGTRLTAQRDALLEVSRKHVSLHDGDCICEDCAAIKAVEENT